MEAVGGSNWRRKATEGRRRSHSSWPRYMDGRGRGRKKRLPERPTDGAESLRKRTRLSFPPPPPPPCQQPTSSNHTGSQYYNVNVGHREDPWEREHTSWTSIPYSVFTLHHLPWVLLGLLAQGHNNPVRYIRGWIRLGCTWCALFLLCVDCLHAVRSD